MRKTLITLLILFSLALAGAVGFVVYMETRVPEQTIQIAPTESTTLAPTTLPPTTLPPEPEYFTLTFAGDFTPGCMPGQFENPLAYVGTVGDDYEFPFANMMPWFGTDDFTFLNLESVLGDAGTPANKRFVFYAPEEYVNIMTSSSVEAVTLANNHTEDMGPEGYDNTKRILEENGVAYVEKDKTAIFTTESGLTIGLYADAFDFTEQDIYDNIALLHQQGAEIIICAFHWGGEGVYRPTDKQITYGHLAIDCGADIVVGHHPHVLQKMEEYEDGLIFYSLGNFSFGGNTHPRDRDSAIISQQIVRDPDGTVHLGQTTLIPIAISSISERNNYQPIPYEEGSEGYLRVLSKLDGTFNGSNLQPGYDYSMD